jgi:hypothetical protein
VPHELSDAYGRSAEVHGARFVQLIDGNCDLHRLWAEAAAAEASGASIGLPFQRGAVMSQQSKHPLLRENSTRRRLYEAFDPSCSTCDQLSQDFWWLEDKEPWRRVAAEIAAANSAQFMMDAAVHMLRAQAAQARASADQRETRH